eukprot:m.22744 g.22744  ORF g.22744 m.22744 type:complete len:623 (-) comp7432_c1_seq1:178-2046(-)
MQCFCKRQFKHGINHLCARRIRKGLLTQLWSGDISGLLGILGALLLADVPVSDIKCCLAIALNFALRSSRFSSSSKRCSGEKRRESVSDEGYKTDSEGVSEILDTERKGATSLAVKFWKQVTYMIRMAYVINANRTKPSPAATTPTITIGEFLKHISAHSLVTPAGLHTLLQEKIKLYLPPPHCDYFLTVNLSNPHTLEEQYEGIIVDFEPQNCALESSVVQELLICLFDTQPERAQSNYENHPGKKEPRSYKQDHDIDFRNHEAKSELNPITEPSTQQRNFFLEGHEGLFQQSYSILVHDVIEKYFKVAEKYLSFEGYPATQDVITNAQPETGSTPRDYMTVLNTCDLPQLNFEGDDHQYSGDIYFAKDMLKHHMLTPIQVYQGVLDGVIWLEGSLRTEPQLLTELHDLVRKVNAYVDIISAHRRDVGDASRLACDDEEREIYIQWQEFCMIATSRISAIGLIREEIQRCKQRSVQLRNMIRQEARAFQCDPKVLFRCVNNRYSYLQEEQTQVSSSGPASTFITEDISVNSGVTADVTSEVCVSWRTDYMYYEESKSSNLTAYCEIECAVQQTLPLGMDKGHYDNSYECEDEQPQPDWLESHGPEHDNFLHDSLSHEYSSY